MKCTKGFGLIGIIITIAVIAIGGGGYYYVQKSNTDDAQMESFLDAIESAEEISDVVEDTQKNLEEQLQKTTESEMPPTPEAPTATTYVLARESDAPYRCSNSFDIHGHDYFFKEVVDVGDLAPPFNAMRVRKGDFIYSWSDLQGGDNIKYNRKILEDRFGLKSISSEGLEGDDLLTQPFPSDALCQLVDSVNIVIPSDVVFRDATEELLEFYSQ